MRIQRFKHIIICIALLFEINCVSVQACTYEEALNCDYTGYNKQDVIRILREDLSQESQLTSNQRKACLIGEMQNFYSDFNKYSKNINYEALAAISALETGYFSSSLCKNQNNVGGLCNSNGFLYFTTKEKGIQALSQLLTNEYLDPDGRYFEGTTILDVSKHYNPEPHWVELYVKVRLDMEHRIPQEPSIKLKLLQERRLLCHDTYQINKKTF